MCLVLLYVRGFYISTICRLICHRQYEQDIGAMLCICVCMHACIFSRPTILSWIGRMALSFLEHAPEDSAISTWDSQAAMPVPCLSLVKLAPLLFALGAKWTWRRTMGLVHPAAASSVRLIVSWASPRQNWNQMMELAFFDPFPGKSSR